MANLSKWRLIDTRTGSYLLASFPGPAQLSAASTGEISVPRPIGLPHTVSETTGNEIPARTYTPPLFLKHTSCWKNYTYCKRQKAERGLERG